MNTTQKTELTIWASVVARRFWSANPFAGKTIGPCPIIEINARLRVTAGRAWINHTEPKVDLSASLMLKYKDLFRSDIIPHELCHHIAYRLYDDHGHGPAWKDVMRTCNLRPILFYPEIVR